MRRARYSDDVQISRSPPMRLLVLAFLLPLLAEAAPAPYFLWQSKLDGIIICRQSSPGHGWDRLDGRAFRDLNCTLPAARVEQPQGVPGFRSQPGR